jgi:FK506-binding protein 4/5
MDTAEKIEAAGKKKEDGNALFKAGKYLRASKKYDKASCWPTLIDRYWN